MAEHAHTTGRINALTSTRRRLLTGAAAAVTGAGLAAVYLSPDPDWSSDTDAVVLPSADAALLALCDRFHVLDRQAHALDGRVDKAAETAREACWAKQEPLIEQMSKHGARTLVGFQSLARVYAAWEGPGVESLLDTGLTGDTLLGTLLRDLGAVSA